MRSSSMTHCLQSSLTKRYVWKLKNSFTKEKAQDHVLCSEQIRNVCYKIYQDKKQDHLGKHKAMHRASGKPDATLWITEFQAYPSEQFNRRMNRQQTVSKLIEKFESHEYEEQFLKDMSQTQKINRFSEASQKLLKDMD